MTGDETEEDLHAILMRLLELSLDLARYKKSVNGASLPPPGKSGEEDYPPLEPAGFLGIARRLLREVDARRAHFEEDVSHDSAWAILLDLYVQTAQGKRVTVSDACIASRARPTTALRWIANLVERGMVVRTPDGSDRRRVYLALTNKGFTDISRYLASITGIVPGPAPARTAHVERKNQTS